MQREPLSSHLAQGSWPSVAKSCDFFQEKLANRILTWKPVFKEWWKLNKICLSIIQATGLPLYEKAPQNEKWVEKYSSWGLHEVVVRLIW